MNKLFFSSIPEGSLLFSRFEAQRCLSSSDVGAVYLCSDLHLGGEAVALKIISIEDHSKQALIDSIQREMTICSMIDHPHVVRSQHFFKDDQFIAFSMEYYEGGTLADKIAAHGEFSIEQIRKILSQILTGLRAIHREGVIHRDIKPENLLLDSMGNIKIADFGIALDGNSGADCTHHLVGTMNYLAPEYIERGQTDQRSDLYAVGVIGYELLTGRLPFEKKSLVESLTSRVKFDPLEPSNLRTDCPKSLSRIILRALSRKPVERFQTAHEMLEAVRRLDAEQWTDSLRERALQASSDLLHSGLRVPAVVN